VLGKLASVLEVEWHTGLLLGVGPFHLYQQGQVPVLQGHQVPNQEGGHSMRYNFLQAIASILGQLSVKDPSLEQILQPLPKISSGLLAFA